MISNSSGIHQLKAQNETFPKEVLNWYYNNNKDTMLIIWNIDHEIMYVSQQMEEYLNEKMSNLIGKQWTTIMPEEQIIQISNHFEATTEKLHISNIILRKQDSDFSFNAIVDKILIDDQKVYICKLKNITYMNELKKVLLDSEKLILAGQLSAGLVHEIRNPLTSLKGFLQLVQAGVEQKEEYYKVMIGEIDKLEKITSELLHMAKPFKNNKKNESIHEMIKDVVFIMSTQMDMKDIHFTLDLEDNLHYFCNASQIKQVLINLIKNGAEAMNKSGTIMINSRIEDNQIAIDIIDEGQGMSDEIVQELNNPFFTTKPDGTGLGLVITHHILEMHNGLLKVSTDENKGSIFTILLPLVDR